MSSPGRFCPNPQCKKLIKTARGHEVWIASVIDGGGFPKERWFCSERCVIEFAEYRIRTFKKCLINVVKRGDETLLLDDSKVNCVDGQTSFTN